MILMHASGILDNLMSIPSDLTFIHYASGYRIRLWVIIRLAAALGVISSIAVIFYQCTKAFRARRFHDKSSDSTFAGWETTKQQHRKWGI